MKIKNIIVFILGSIAAALLYVVLSESFTFVSFALGAVLGVGAMAISILLFPGGFLGRYSAKPLALLWYFIRLIFIIIISGFKSLYLGLFKKPASLLIEYKSSLKSDMLVTLLANSITLTPGTTTIDKNGNTLRVMKLGLKSEKNNVDDIEILERMLKKAERSVK